MIEIWKDIKGYGGLYQVSNYGNVKSLNYNKTGEEQTLIPTNHRGYLQVTLRGKQISIHRLVADAFIPNPNNYPVVNHIDKNPYNNNVDNLEWCTQQYNVEYSIGRPVLQYSKSGEFISEYKSGSEASIITGICTSNILKCCHDERYTAGGYKWKFK